MTVRGAVWPWTVRAPKRRRVAAARAASRSPSGAVVLAAFERGFGAQGKGLDEGVGGGAFGGGFLAAGVFQGDGGAEVDQRGRSVGGACRAGGQPVNPAVRGRGRGRGLGGGPCHQALSLHVTGGVEQSRGLGFAWSVRRGRSARTTRSDQGMVSAVRRR
ncbi:hypothetical protein FDG2_1448 [Candidatus Protofrankia californiensis]|uniref:Uncharacterized protein n=1 Tax=Candidatus Protofrankia californiensis TaxID=1839754 RepID=A0A1C3NVL9_9ACTN|nr:hypothetical protein FDG2_1448 [Candidatus Protofrankia californiensis]